MKRFLVIVLLVLSIATLFASNLEGKEKADVSFSSHIYGESVMLFGYPTLGGAWDNGITIDSVTIAAYIRYSHLFRPLGSTTGKLVIAEELGEGGLSFKVRFYENGRFNMNLGINTGWYQQWVMLNSTPGSYHLIHNGLIIRPECSIGWRLIGKWNVELGFFYQSPLYPTYDDYQGWGIFIKAL